MSKPRKVHLVYREVPWRQPEPRCGGMGWRNLLVTEDPEKVTCKNCQAHLRIVGSRWSKEWPPFRRFADDLSFGPWFHKRKRAEHEVAALRILLERHQEEFDELVEAERAMAALGAL